jgi:fructosamine-3-kinase
MTLHQRIHDAIGHQPSRLTALHGGCIAEVYRADMPDGSRLVVKAGPADGTLHIEGWMLEYLARNSRLPVPRIVHSQASLLVMEYIEGQSRFSPGSERHAAELLADLHGISAPAFGLERDTLIGPLHQPNPDSASWIDFFRQHRLLYMARLAADDGPLPPRTLSRIQRLAERLPELLDEPQHPSLLHGDVWTTNVLARMDKGGRDGRIVAFLDPAIYYGHPEIELAFTTLFGTFGQPFFERYQELRPLRPGFFETRRDIYNLYPLLVHVRLFGAGYLAQVEAILSRAGV